MSGRREGAFFYENLMAFRRGEEWLGSTEVMLFTDAWVTGEYNRPPYEFLNTVPVSETLDVKPAIILRVAFHWQHTLPPPADRKTEASRYHKGWLDDEAAALASLILGIRIQCGPTTREFRPGDSVAGRPCYQGGKKLVMLPPKNDLRLPSMQTSVALGVLNRMEDMEQISPTQSAALIKAARLYQQALWLAEIDAADAWLLMVSAIETAANCWRNEIQSPMEEFKLGSPELFAHLSSFENEEMIEGAAKILRGKSRVKAKFIDFLTRFLPAAPSARPPEGFRIPWEDTHFRSAFAKIYDHRSRALHDGIGFPFPMTERPIKMDKAWEGPAERPGGLSTSTLGATWDREDCPMLLHIFAYIVQHALLSWWASEASGTSSVATPSSATTRRDEDLCR